MDNQLYNQQNTTNIVEYHHNEPKKDVRVMSTTIINDPAHLFLKDNIYIGNFNFIEASKGVYIGEGVQITSFCNITTHSSHISIRLYGKKYMEHSEHIGYVKGSIKIGDYTFVGSHSVIMPDTIIGKGCLIKAHSYVKGDFPDFSIIGGNPAEVIGSTKDLDKRFLESNSELNDLYKQWAKI